MSRRMLYISDKEIKQNEDIINSVRQDVSDIDNMINNNSLWRVSVSVTDKDNGYSWEGEGICAIYSSIIQVQTISQDAYNNHEYPFKNWQILYDPETYGPTEPWRFYDQEHTVDGCSVIAVNVVSGEEVDMIEI